MAILFPALSLSSCTTGSFIEIFGGHRRYV